MKPKVCIICGEDIIEDREKWVRLTDYDCGIELKECFYHYECWHERFMITNSDRKKNMYTQALRSLKPLKNIIG